MSIQQTKEDLHKAVEHIITTYGPTQPDLARELKQIQVQLLELDRRNDNFAWTKKALQVAALIKFVCDIWP